MSNISIIEFAVYGFVAYSSLLMLIISVIKEPPSTKSLAIARSIFLIPGMICAAILAGSGVNITVQTTNTSNLIKDLNTTDTWTETTLQSQAVILANPVWTTVHVLIFMVLLFYIVTQVLILLTKHDEQARPR